MAPIHKLIIASHGDTIYFVDFDEDARQLSLRNSKRMPEQPSWIAPSPNHADLVYVNSWVEGKIFAVRIEGDDGKVVSTCESGGKGPTHMQVSADGKGLLVVMYAANTLSYLPLEVDGTFSQDAPSPRHIHHFPFVPPTPPNERQDGAHPHHIIQTAEASEVLVPTLGSDKIWLMRWGPADGGWQAVRSIDVAPGSGPRHGVIDAKNQYLYVLHELASYVSVHSLDPKRCGEIMQTISSLPTQLQGIRHKYGPMDLIASEIALLKPVREGGSSLLLATNRAAPLDLAPQRDSIAVYSLSESAASPALSQPRFLYTASRHVRGMAVSPDERFVITMGRDEGGLTLFERNSDGELRVVVANALADRLDKPVGALWRM